MNKGLEAAIKELNKKYGEDSIQVGNVDPIEKIPLDFISIDKLTGGGFPKARWSMIFGSKGTCKTSICTKMATNVIKGGGSVVWIDAEHSFDKEYSKTLGLDPDKLFFSQPESLEQAITTIQKTGPFADLIVMDSIVSIATEHEKDRELEKDTMAVIPRKLSQFFRVVTPTIGKSKAVVILVNQSRLDLSMTYPVESYPGGHALAHYSALILHLRRGAKADSPMIKVDGKDQEIGFNMHTKIVKSKIGPTEGKQVSFNYYYDQPHFNYEDDLVTNSIVENVIQQAGAWYNYGELKWQGRDNIIEAVKADKKLSKQMEKDLLKIYQK